MRGLKRLIASGFAAAMFAACGTGSPSGCDRHGALWIHAVLPTGDCPECVDFAFDSPITGIRSFRVRPKPDLVLAGCDVRHVLVDDQAVTLLLSRAKSETLIRAREAWKASGTQLAAIRLADAPSLTSIKNVRDLRPVLVLFDFEDRSQIDAFAHTFSGAGKEQPTESAGESAPGR